MNICKGWRPRQPLWETRLCFKRDVGDAVPYRNCFKTPACSYLYTEILSSNLFERNALSRSYFLHCETIGTAKMGGQPSGWLLTKSKVLKDCYASRAKGARLVGACVTCSPRQPGCDEHLLQTYSSVISFSLSAVTLSISLM